MKPVREPNIKYLTELTRRILKFMRSIHHPRDDGWAGAVVLGCRYFLKGKDPDDLKAVHFNLRCLGLEEAAELIDELETELVECGTGVYKDEIPEKESAEYRETVEDNEELRRYFKVYKTESDKDEEGPIDIGQLLPEGKWEHLLDNAMSGGAKRNTLRGSKLNPLEHLYYSCGGRQLRKKLSDPECKKKIYAEILDAQLVDYVVVAQMAMQVLTNYEQVYQCGYMSDDSSLFNSALRIKMKADAAARAVMAADAKLQGLPSGAINVTSEQTQINIGVSKTSTAKPDDNIQNQGNKPRPETEHRIENAKIGEKPDVSGKEDQAP